MKTGTLKRVKNISGYVKSKNGRLYTVVILVNSKAGNWRASQLQNNVMKWMVKYKGRGAVRAMKTPVVKKKKSVIASQQKTSTKNEDAMSSSGPYYIQTGSFAKEPTSEYLAKIKKLGLLYSIERKDKYKVFVGPYNFESTARKSLLKVRKHINKGAFLVDNLNLQKSEKAVALY